MSSVLCINQLSAVRMHEDMKEKDELISSALQ